MVWRYLGELKRLRHLRYRGPADVLSVDDGHSIVAACVPPDYKVFGLPIRGEYWYVNVVVGIYFLQYLLKHRRLGLCLRGCYVAALAKALRARLILTFIDTNNWDTNLAEVSGLRVVCVANAVRTPSLVNPKQFDIYFHPGAFPLCSSLGFRLRANAFHPVGQLRAGIFLRRMRDSDSILDEEIRRSRKTIAWISQFRPEAVDEVLAPIFKDKARIEEKLLTYLRRYSSERGFSISVALSAAAPKRTWIDTEVTYYQERLGSDVALVYRQDNAWASYETAWNASLVVGLCSNLLHECLALGLRTLFCYPAFSGPLLDHVTPMIDTRRLEKVALSGTTYQSFAESCDRLLDYPDLEYSAILQDYREDLTCFDNDLLPQERIQKELSSLLEAGTG